MRFFSVVAATVILTSGVYSTSFGHGPQIQLTSEGGKIVTREVMVDVYHTPLTAVTSIYVLPVVEISTQWRVQPGPGIAPGAGYVDDASHPFKAGSYTTSIVDGLKKWDGTSFVDAGAAQLQLYKGATTATTSDASPFASITYSLSTMSEEAHSSMGFRFLGDGVSNTSVLADGVYLLSLKISTAGLTDSDPFYFILPKGVSAGETGAATFAWAQQQGIEAGEIQALAPIPEPASLALAAVAMGGCVAVRRRLGARQQA